MSFTSSASVTIPAGTARAFKQTRRGNQAARRSRVLARASSESNRVSRNLAAGLAAVASIPLLLNGPAIAFVGNTAKDFSEKVEQVTPDVNLPGLKQKGKEAEAIGKTKGGQSNAGATEQFPDPEAIISKGSAAQAKGTLREGGGVAGGEFTVKGIADDAKGALKDAGPKQGLFGRIKDEALTSNSPSVQMNK